MKADPSFWVRSGDPLVIDHKLRFSNTERKFNYCKASLKADRRSFDFDRDLYEEELYIGFIDTRGRMASDANGFNVVASSKRKTALRTFCEADLKK